MGNGITVVGLGPGDVGLLTREAWTVLSEARVIYLRTGHHPVADGFPPSVVVKTFDHLYEKLGDFEAVYQSIVDQVIRLARDDEGVIYAVPGDPMIGEATVEALRKSAKEEALPIKLIHGISFIEPCLAAMGIDALDGLAIADALELAAGHHPPFPPDTPALVGQLYSRMVAADVKLTLMNQYPDEHPVCLIHFAGTPDEEIERTPLHDIDRSPRIGSMTTLFVPPLSIESAFESFQETVAHLRAPDGCLWDREQTHETLRKHILEETYEALHAIDTGDLQALREELGDLLLQIVLQAQIAAEAGEFTMSDVIADIQAKIVRRHPHVFSELHLADVDQVLHNWEALKAEEREDEGTDKGLLDGVPLDFPALAQASEIQDRVVRVGFDWPEVEGVLSKIEEELREVQQAEGTEERSAEMGDLLFATVNYARWLGVDPESALRTASRRFRRRFGFLEAAARAKGRHLTEMTLEEMEDLWQAAKEEEH